MAAQHPVIDISDRLREVTVALALYVKNFSYKSKVVNDWQK
jgi:hypothetical protein